MGKSSLCLLAFLAVLAIGAAEEMYPDTYDHIDPHDILNNDELRNEYYNCVMETGPCRTDEQKFMKGMIFYLFQFELLKAISYFNIKVLPLGKRTYCGFK